MEAPLPPNEIARLRALKELRLLDTPADHEFDELSRLAAMACGTPRAFVTLIGSDRQWLKAAFGAEPFEIPRREAFCAHTILLPEGVLLIPDARLDERFSDNPKVVDGDICFYAGVPLKLPTGEALGALCVVDDHPRQLNKHQLDMLIGLGKLANSNLAKRQRRATAAGYSQEVLPISVTEHLALISRFTSNGVLLTDANNTILWMNDGSARITGYQPDEVIGQTPSLFRSPNTDPATLDHIREQLAAKKPVQCEILNRSKKGIDYWINLEIQPICDDLGELRGFIGFQTDITERKRNERLKSEFLATVSHELRTPLTSIIGAIGLLISGEVATLPPSAHSLLRIAQKNGERLSELINDLLDMEKLIAGGMPFNIEPLPLAPLIQESLEENAPYAHRHDVTLVATDHPTPFAVVADRTRLKQILTNFLSNGAKFSAPDSQVEIYCTQHDQFVRIHVRDHGTGVPENFRDRLFEKFAQADGSNTRIKGGTGLGLAICKALAEEMNGRVGYEPAPEGGSIFYVTLPASET
ncbi:MAG: PAS domain-containing protein [Natronospirillum sp.]